MSGVYRYDGTFAGLLTLLAHLLPKRILPDAISIDPPLQQGLFDEVITIETNRQHVEEFWAELEKRLTPSCLSHIRQAFLADQIGREMMICRYLLLSWEVGKQIGGLLAHPHVTPLWKLSRQVGGEAHRYKGFVRFQETGGGFFYSAISPGHWILSLIAPHFAARFADQHWVIHDMNHGEGIVHDRHRREWLILPMEINHEPDLTPAEERFQALWRSYFNTLAIAARENLRLQRSKVPLKVRPWLVEFAQGRSSNDPFLVCVTDYNVIPDK
jgi:probable DNA metabolism protein